MKTYRSERVQRHWESVEAVLRKLSHPGAMLEWSSATVPGRDAHVPYRAVAATNVSKGLLFVAPQ